jgi:hypothetical protein
MPISNSVVKLSTIGQFIFFIQFTKKTPINLTSIITSAFIVFLSMIQAGAASVV